MEHTRISGIGPSKAILSQRNYNCRRFNCWTKESPREHVAKFYGRLRLIPSVFRASKFSVIKIDWNYSFVDLLHHPIWLYLDLALLGHHFSNFELLVLCLAKDRWWGSSTRNAHLIHIVNHIRFKMVYTF